MSPATWLRLLGLSTLVLTLGFVVPGWTQAKAKGKRYALLVGVSGYKRETFPNLKYTENDVEKLAEILTKAGYTKVRVLTNTRGDKNPSDAPTAANIVKALDELTEDKGRNDTVLLALSGHGAAVEVPDPEEKEKPKVYPFFCPHDADLVKISYSTGRSKSLINVNDILTQLGRCGASNKLVLMDACRNELKAEGSTRSLDEGAVRVPKGVGVLFSCSPEERAWESEKLKHGVFFHFVLEGMKEKAKNEDGEVTWLSLSAYVTRQVQRQVPVIIREGASQKPHSVGNVPGDPILVLLGKSVAEKPKDKDGKEEVVDDKRKEEFTNSIGMKFKLIPKGTFLMGSTEEEREAAREDMGLKEQLGWLKAEGPRHEVTISKPFYMGIYEVTQGQWKAVMGKGNNPSCFRKNGDGKDDVKDFTEAQLSR